MKKNKSSEDAVADWVDQVDLSKKDYSFKPASFKNLGKTDWEEFYDENQKASVPVRLRLPKFFIAKIKQKAVESGIPYQSIIRLWIAERLGLREGE